MAESEVVVSPSGGGPHVRTVQVDEQHSGTPVAVEQQVVVLANPDGSLVDLQGIEGLADLIRVQNAILRSISMQIAQLTAPAFQITDLTLFMQDETLQ